MCDTQNIHTTDRGNTEAVLGSQIITPATQGLGTINKHSPRIANLLFIEDYGSPL